MSTLAINFSPLLQRYTLEELWELPEREDGAHYNLIAGFHFLVPRPDPPHGDVVSWMCTLLIKFIITNNIAGDIYFPPEPICMRAESSTYLEPDLMYVSRESRQSTGAYRTSADIVIEVISRETSVYDRTIKADTYLALGVRELWLVNPFGATIEVRHASKAGEILMWRAIEYSHGQHAKSHVLEGFQVLLMNYLRRYS